MEEYVEEEGALHTVTKKENGCPDSRVPVKVTLPMTTPPSLSSITGKIHKKWVPWLPRERNWRCEMDFAHFGYMVLY